MNSNIKGIEIICISVEFCLSTVRDSENFEKQTLNERMVMLNQFLEKHGLVVEKNSLRATGVRGSIW